MRGCFISLLVVAGVIQARTVHETLHLQHGSVNPDGFPRPGVLVNNMTPGPILTAQKGEDFRIKVVNNLDNPEMRRSTTIHWHGIFQPRKAYDDGPGFVTQCPISPVPPTNSYTYGVETGEQAGTFWYHSHLKTQYVDGLRGALIIYDKNDPHAALYDVDDKSTVITLNDWYHASAEKLRKDWLGNRAPEPVPDSNLLNGFGRYQGGPKVQRSVIVVKQGLRYRFRIINMSAIVPFNFAVENHTLTVIEADGVSHEPTNVASVEIAVGQRYSVVLRADKPIRNYWIAYPSDFRDTTVPSVNKNYNGTEAFAVLRYEGAPKSEPTTPEFVPDNSKALQEHVLKPLENPRFPEKADMTLDMRFKPENPGQVDTPGGASIWSINGVHYRPPSVPTLLSILSSSVTNQFNFTISEGYYVLPRNATVDVRLIGDSHHPFHLHGHTFQVIQSATGPRNLVNPPIRDVVETSDEKDPNKVVTLRFRTDNPGPWLLHCHKDWHLEAGLVIVFVEDPKGQKSGPTSVKPPEEWKALCGIYNALPKELQ